MEKQTYLIKSYIPSDDNVVVSDIYKLQELGLQETKIFIFICITDRGGYGTGVKDFGHKTELDAIYSLIRQGTFNSSETEYYKIGKMTFEESVEERNRQINKLSKQLIKEATEL